ncbi:MAG TPA: hypothetical protein VJ846_13555, partial [Sphingomicrobium sp.]|nr:hypothetical protein [Sphingomicrobium sp.]
MADIVHRDELATGGKRPNTGTAQGAETARTGRADRPPRSDVGTILLHWITALGFVVSLLTGIRIATFGWVLPSVSQGLSPIMPQGEMWTWHFFA